MPTIRFTGVTSGLDVDGIVRQLMAIERRPVVQLTQRRDAFQARLDAWKAIRAKLDSLQNALKTLRTSTQVFNARQATVGDSTLLTATASAGAAPAEYQVTVNALAQTHIVQLAGNTPISSATAQLRADTITIRAVKADGTGVIDKVITIDPGTGENDTLEKIAGTINSWTDVRLKARVVQVSPGDYQLVIEEQRQGANYRFSVWEDEADDQFKAPAVAQVGQDASVTVGGITYTRTTNTVDDIIPGVTLTLKKTGGPTTLTVAEDLDTTVNAIKDLVNAYNALADAVKEHSGYSSDGKKVGALFGDTSLTSLVSGLRHRLVTPADPAEGVPEAVNSLAMIGITTDYTTGRLQLDETKLRDRLKQYGSGIQTLFQHATEGIAARAESYLSTWTGTGGLVQKSTESLEQQVKRIQDRITYYEEIILPKREQTLRQQFTRLDQLLGQLQTQGAWLSAQLAGLQR